jgi:hypothetical protein
LAAAGPGAATAVLKLRLLLRSIRGGGADSPAWGLDAMRGCMCKQEELLKAGTCDQMSRWPFCRMQFGKQEGVGVLTVRPGAWTPWGAVCASGRIKGKDRTSKHRQNQLKRWSVYGGRSDRQKNRQPSQQSTLQRVLVQHCCLNLWPHDAVTAAAARAAQRRAAARASCRCGARVRCVVQDAQLPSSQPSHASTHTTK